MGRSESRTEKTRDSSEAALLSRLLAGEEDAYSELIRAHGGRMLSVARRILRSDEDAEDAVQDAFVSAFRSLDRFQGKSRFGTWLHRIATNSALMLLRKRPARAEIDIEFLLPEFLEGRHHAGAPPRWSELPEEEASRRELWNLVREKIDELPENYRIPLLLYDIEHLEMAEIAEQMKITKNAVKVRLCRARQALRGLLSPSMVESAG